MREYEVTYQEGLIRGLRPSKRNALNVQFLVQSQGMFPEDGALISVPEVNLMNGITALGEVFPYPIVHVGQAATVVFGATKLWEMDGNGDLVLQLSGLTPGGLWSVADFYHYIVASNGVEVVRRNTETELWEIVDEETLPPSYSMAAVNGQLIVGSPVGSW